MPVYHYDDGALTLDQIPHTPTGSQAEAVAFMCQELAQDIKDHPEAYPPERLKHIRLGTMNSDSFFYVRDCYAKDFEDNYVKYLQAYSQNRDSVPVPIRAFFTVWFHDRRVPLSPPGYSPLYDGGFEGPNALPTMKFIKDGAPLRPAEKHITTIPEYIEAHIPVYVACGIGLLVLLAQGVHGWINERKLERWWADNQPEALAAKLKTAAFFAGVKSATLTMPGGRTVTGELNILRHEEGSPWFRITEGAQNEFHSLAGASIENPLNPDSITLPDGLTLHLQRDEAHQRMLQRIRQRIDAL